MLILFENDSAVIDYSRKQDTICVCVRVDVSFLDDVILFHSLLQIASLSFSRNMGVDLLSFPRCFSSDPVDTSAWSSLPFQFRSCFVYTIALVVMVGGIICSYFNIASPNLVAQKSFCPQTF